MKRLIKSVIVFTNRAFNFIKTLNRIYKDGGIKSVKIAQIEYGNILKGKNVLITGGSSGIGLSIARKCFLEGANVLICGRDEEKLKKIELEINDKRFSTIVWDLSDLSILDNNIETTKNHFNKKIDILVNNAGIISGTNFPYVTEDIWDKIYSTNSKGLYFITQAICNLWLLEKRTEVRKVINISSQGGFVGATYPYRLTKWDIVGLTQGLGIKLAPKGIIVNGIAPGIVATGMQPFALKQKDNFFTDLNPLNRIALPEEIAELAIFLMSDSCNYIVGQTILCDGGFSIK